jgi:hypothetical protein
MRDVRNLLLTAILVALVFVLMLLARARFGRPGPRPIHCTGGSEPILVDGRTVGCTR